MEASGMRWVETIELFVGKAMQIDTVLIVLILYINMKDKSKAARAVTYILTALLGIAMWLQLKYCVCILGS